MNGRGDMSNMTVCDIEADISKIMEGFASGKRLIPSSLSLLKVSLIIPVISVIISFLSVLALYISYGQNGYIDFVLSDGWIVIIPTAAIGLFFSFMAYSNLIMYMSVPEEIRRSSKILSHLRSVVSRTVTIFLSIMLISALIAGFYSRAAFLIPLLEFLLIFAVNIVVGSEINRMGAGFAIEKMSAFIKKI